VYRFRTFEESDELILRMLTRLRKPGPRSHQTGLGRMDTLADGRAFDTTEIKRKIGA
jgi:hypothetical protein